MPKRTDIKKIMIIGAGPIVIGQACGLNRYEIAMAACGALAMTPERRNFVIARNPRKRMTWQSLFLHCS